jgi:hypothetical protein
MKVRFIGDTHGVHVEHLDIINLNGGCDLSIQVGDYGYHAQSLRDNLRLGKDFCLAGNHTCYDPASADYYLKQPFDLGDFGEFQTGGTIFPKVFYVRGGFSIDWTYRKRMQEWPYLQETTWWPEEELSYQKLEEAIEAWSVSDAEILVSHEASNGIVAFLTNPDFVKNWGYESGVIDTRTSLAIARMIEVRKPTICFNGHYHFPEDMTLDGVRYVSLDMTREENPSHVGVYFDLDI